MQHFLRELIRIEINNKEMCFNGFFSADEYTQYLNGLYMGADITFLLNDKYVEFLRKHLEDFIVMLDAYLPMYQETVDSMKHDARNSPYLQEEADWYQMLFEIRSAKLYYYYKLMEELSPNTANTKEIVVDEPEKKTIQTLAKGVMDIGNVLGCKKTKAQEIINTGFLTNYEVGYYVGRTPVLDLSKWDKLPSAFKAKICNNKSKT